MIICVECKKEMICNKTGAIVKFIEGHHCYSSDVYVCGACGLMVAVANNNSFYVEHPVNHPSDINMELSGMSEQKWV